jgi:hypothetical protein
MALKKFNIWREEMSPPLGQEKLTGGQDDTKPVASPTVAKPVVISSPVDSAQKERATPSKPKPWKASKKQVLNFWKSLDPNAQIKLKPISITHRGSTIQEDSVRVTGSKEFIASVIAHLKDFLKFENEKNKLVVQYRQSARSLKPGAKDSYMIYIQVKERESKSF